MSKQMKDEWSKPVIITCRCRHVFRSRIKEVEKREGAPRVVTETPCPNCEATDDSIGTASDWGEFTE